MYGVLHLLFLFNFFSVNAQTNPTPHNLSSSDFSFSGLALLQTNYPTSMQGWQTSANNINTAETVSPTGDYNLSLLAPGIVNNLLNGFTLQSSGSGTSRRVGSLALALNTIGRDNITVSWIAEDLNAATRRQTNLTLQYRIGNTGNFTSIGGSTYTTNTNSQKSATNFSITLPYTCIDEPLVQLRWIYYETGNASSTRDPIRLDDISVTSNVMTCTQRPSNILINYVGTTTAEISWTAASPIPASGYDYYYSTNNTQPNETTNPTGNTTFTSLNITGLTQNTTYYFWVRSKCGGGNQQSKWVSGGSFRTYCRPSVGNGYENDNYLTKVSFLGALSADFTISSLYSSSPRGYEDFTGSSYQKAVQAQGNGINVYLEGILGNETHFKAWVDWNKDGLFDNNDVVIDNNGNLSGTGERVYNPYPYLVETATFGLKIPNNVQPGNYRLRIRGNLEGGTSNFDSCGNIDNGGETEDYIITVIANCPSIITAKVNGIVCGTNSVQLQATATSGVTQFRWYDSETGGTLMGTSSVTGNSTIWSTPSVSTTTTFYVAAYNGTCESLVRIPVDARIKLVPNLTFSSSNPTICGEKSIISISATGGNQLDYLLEEDFESGGLGVFTHEFLTSNTGYYPTNQTTTTYNNFTIWKNKSSTYVPSKSLENFTTWFPAIFSGVGGNKFIVSTSDHGNNNIIVNNAIKSPIIDTTPYTNLTLTFKMYFSRYFPDTGVNQHPNDEYIELEVSTNGGATWTPVNRISSDVGIGTRFEKKTYDLSTYVGNNNFSFRIRYYAREWYDGVAIDDIELYGERPLTNVFDWSSDYPIQVYSDAAATVLYTGTPINTIYVKPTSTELESYSSWDLSATAMLTNGCSTSGDITIHNDTKVWNIPAQNDWKTTNWKPVTTEPDITNCIIVKTPVNLLTKDGIGKNIVVKSGGILNIKKGNTLTIKEDITNEAAVGDFVVESDANLIQIDKLAINTGNITVKRDSKLKRLDYNYWGTPVNGQNLRAFSPATLNTRFYVYNETNDYFDGIFVKNAYPDGSPSLTPLENANTYNFVPGKGYAIRSPNNYTNTITTFNGKYEGLPNNGDVKINVTNTKNGYNLLANPYPSNFDFYQLADNNPAVIEKLAYFWTNLNPNPKMQGSNYPTPVNGVTYYNNYAILTGTGGTPATLGTTPTKSDIPNRYIKVGQGFIVKAKNTGGEVKFENTLRTNNSTSNFFNKGIDLKEETIDRFWLMLKSPLDVYTTILVGYVNGATNNFELSYDAPILVEGSDALFTILGDKKLAIQGRNFPLDTQDIIPLGTRQDRAGVHTFMLGDKEGIFANGQAIYLKDKLTGIVTNLSENNYQFTADAGELLSRFEIQFTSLGNSGTLGTNTSVKDNIQFFEIDKNYTILSPTVKIDKVELLDSSGKLLNRYIPKANECTITTKDLSNGVYIVNVLINNERKTFKFIKK